MVLIKLVGKNQIIVNKFVFINGLTLLQVIQERALFIFDAQPFRLQKESNTVVSLRKYVVS